MESRQTARLLKALAVTVIAGCLSLTPVAAKDLQIFTEENKPLNFTEGGKVTGYATEIVQEIQKRLGTNEAIQVVP